MARAKSFQGTLRRRILAFVSALIVLSLFGSTISLYRITEVNHSLDAINHVSVPLGKLFAQMQADADVLKRELNRRLGYSHWGDPHWRPRPIPKWLEDVIQSEIARAGELTQKEDLPWPSAQSRQVWKDWFQGISKGFENLRTDAAKLYTALEQRDHETAAQIYPVWSASLDEWSRQIQWGVIEYEKVVRQSFALAETRVADLRTGLEIILIVVVCFSFLLLWVGERALRPLNELTRLAREIARRGLRKEDKSRLPELSLSLARDDEVSQLSREFHHMATSLLEREKTVETQKSRLQDQNRLLQEMGAFNQNILNSIKSILLVTDLEGKITQCNPVASAWLGTSAERVIGTKLFDWPALLSLARNFPGRGKWLDHMQGSEDTHNDTCVTVRDTRIEPGSWKNRIYGGRVMPLRQQQEENPETVIRGAIIVLDDLTDEMDLQERLRGAENLAAVGRMSAQVAHEVRNPLHAIGLEAEMAAELAARVADPSLKQSLQSILISVDRLEKITENYLKLSRLSAGQKRPVDLGEVLESVLATYASACESQGVRVDWARAPQSVLMVLGDQDLLEQALGNLFRNALQALEGHKAPRIAFSLGTAESGRVWLSIEDNGPGISPEIKEKLFTPFVTTRAQGTGLGLSFVKKVIEDHGGSLECVEMKAGACFRMILPATVQMECAEEVLPMEKSLEGGLNG